MAVPWRTVLRFGVYTELDRFTVPCVAGRACVLRVTVVVLLRVTVLPCDLLDLKLASLDTFLWVPRATVFLWAVLFRFRETAVFLWATPRLLRMALDRLAVF